MKISMALLVGMVFGALVFQGQAASAKGDRTITKVIKLLQGMAEKSKEDGEKDTELFAKYKCYCDVNEKSKTDEVASLSKSVEILQGEIAKLAADSTKKQEENAELERMMNENSKARSSAESLRAKAHEDFVSEENDMTTAQGQMEDAIETLAAMNFEDKEALLQEKKHLRKAGMDTKAQKALQAASVFLPLKQQRAMTSFLQGAGAGSVSAAQRGEILGILKNMLETFKANLKNAKEAEKAAAETFAKFNKAKTAEFDELKAAFDDKEKNLGDNKDNLSTKRTVLEESLTQKADNQAFLAKLADICAKKTKDYQERKMIRTNEEAAIMQAITILNSDTAFDTFGDTDAATTGATGFIQLSRSVHTVSVREQVYTQLLSAAKHQKSSRLARAAVALELGTNPYSKVELEVNGLLELIGKEEEADLEQQTWCDQEREDSNTQKEEKANMMETLDGKVTELTDIIENEESGLKKLLADEQTTLAENQKDQATETETRAAENGAYQKAVSNLVKAEKILEKAHKTLKKFYDWLHAKQGPHHYEKKGGKDSGGGNLKRIPEVSTEDLEEACSADPACVGFNSNGWLKSSLQAEDKYFDASSDLYVKVYDSESPVLLQKEDPAPPETWEGEEGYEGQTEKGGEAVEMIAFILQETKDEEKAAHDSENEAQAAFEDTMATLKDEEKKCQDNIAGLEEQLASKSQQLEGATIDLEKTTKEHTALEAYLLKIKPGCDFITENLEVRREARKAETEALTMAMDKLRGTPQFKKALAAEEEAAAGKCAPKCPAGQDKTLECKACIADMSEEGFCKANKKDPVCK